MTQSAAAKALSLPDDPLARGVVEEVRGLVDGNGADAADLVVAVAERTDRRMWLRLDVAVGWDSGKEVRRGAVHPDGSAHFRTFAALEARLIADCAAAAADGKVSAGIAEMIASDPLGRFRSLADAFKVGTLPHLYHYHEACGTCGGHGKHGCDNRWCAFGRVDCLACGGDGKSQCSGCGGRGSVRVQVPGYNGTYQYADETCGSCWGSGRGGYCGAGCMAGKVWCPRCGGSQEVACDPCGATGWFTIRYNTWLTGSVSRSLVFAKGQDDVFKEAVRAIPMMDLPGTHADVALDEAVSGPGTVRVDYACTVPHVHCEMSCKGVPIVVDAVGKTGRVTAMPTFLDHLLGEAREAICGAGRPARAVVEAARTTRVTRDLLAKVCRGNGTVTDGIAARYAGAVSTRTLEAMLDALARTYDGIGAETVRRVWTAGGSAVAFGALLAGLHGVPAQVVSALGRAEVVDLGQAAAPVVFQALTIGVAAGLVAPPLAAIAAFAGSRGRKAVQAVVGKGAVRRPSQGGLPWAFSAGTLVLLMAVLAVGGHLDLPPAETAGARPGGAGAADRGAADWGAGAADEGERMTRLIADSVRREAMAATKKPRLAAKPTPTDAQTVGQPHAYRMQFHLAQLGYYAGPVDGDMGDRSRAALAAFMDVAALDPTLEARFKGKGFLPILEAALDGGVRMPLPADRSVVGPGFSNLARANLRPDDLDRAHAALDRAARAPGREQAWRSADGRRGGRLLVAGEEADGAARCVRYLQEVEVGGAVEQGAVQRACLSGGRWSPR